MARQAQAKAQTKTNNNNNPKPETMEAQAQAKAQPKVQTEAQKETALINAYSKEAVKMLVNNKGNNRKGVITVGKVGTSGTTYNLNNALQSYDKIRKAINDSTRKYGENTLCFLQIGDQKTQFKAGKFSSELLKMLKSLTIEFFHNGNFFDEHENLKQERKIVRNIMLPETITIFDLLPIAIKFGKLTIFQGAAMAKTIAKNNDFKKVVLKNLEIGNNQDEEEED